MPSLYQGGGSPICSVKRPRCKGAANGLRARKTFKLNEGDSASVSEECKLQVGPSHGSVPLAQLSPLPVSDHERGAEEEGGCLADSTFSDASTVNASMSGEEGSKKEQEPDRHTNITGSREGDEAGVIAPGNGHNLSGGDGDGLEADEELRDVELEAIEREQEEEEEEAEEEFNPYSFISLLPPYAQVKHCGPPTPVLPAKVNTRSALSKRKTLVLDLDETLVHCTVEPVQDPDHVFAVNFNNECFQVYVRKRPGLERFLQAVADMFEVVVFTASQRVYAERLLELLDPRGELIRHRLFRDSCLNVEGNFLKDLNVLGRDLASVVIVDNSPYAYGYQMDNGIPIESWFEDGSDLELERLLPVLKDLQGIKRGHNTLGTIGFVANIHRCTCHISQGLMM
ncbi:unnamed protein product [Chrysoparadoxa australica]